MWVMAAYLTVLVEHRLNIAFKLLETDAPFLTASRRS
jgi:hypothetical protein